MQGLDLPRELAELGIEVHRIRDARLVGPEQRPVGLSHPAGFEVRVGGADNQRSRGLGVTHAELQGDLSPVAPTAYQRALEPERSDQRCDVIGDPGIGKLPGRVRRAAVSAAIRGDHPETGGEVGDERLPLCAGGKPAVD
jgi:hypothetical protein